MLKIIDLQVGNIGSVLKAFDFIGVQYDLIRTPSELSGATKIIFPGVGNFTTASDRLFESGFKDALDYYVLELKVPMLGICVGMQLLAKWGSEGRGARGLGYIDTVVNRLNDFSGSLNVPHMGWNDISFGNYSIASGIPDLSCFYFVHSYAMNPPSSIDGLEISYTDYGDKIVAYIRKDNIYGAQFIQRKVNLLD